MVIVYRQPTVPSNVKNAKIIRNFLARLRAQVSSSGSPRIFGGKMHWRLKKKFSVHCHFATQLLYTAYVLLGDKRNWFSNNSRENILCRTQGSGEQQRERERQRARITGEESAKKIAKEGGLGKERGDKIVAKNAEKRKEREIGFIGNN